MSNVQFISNGEDGNHLKTILKYFETADEVWIATAFLKVSGLNLLMPSLIKHIKEDKSINVIAGQNFGLTEPKALRDLRKLFLKKSNAHIYLDNANNKQRIFHPKLFAFRNGNEVYVISGSANITNGGLVGNEELSIGLKTNTASNDWKELMEYYAEIISPKNAKPAGLMIIRRYEKFFNEQRIIRSKQKASPDKKSSDYSFDYTKLRERLENYDLESFNETFRQRILDYKEAKKLMDEIIDSPKLTQLRFEEIIDKLVGKSGQASLWKSGSLFRHRRKVYQCKNEFKKLLKFIKENQKTSAAYVFNNAKQLVEHVKGARTNYVAEIMMTYQPDRFANLNRNPITVLNKEAGVYFKSHSDSFNGDDYEEYCEVTKEICDELGLKNMLEADSFINEVYWELKEEEK